MFLNAGSRGIFDRCFSNTNALPHINIGTDVWGESSIMTGVYQRWCSSTLHIRWGLCDRVCQVLVCRGRYCLGGGGSSLHSGIEFGQRRTCEGSPRGRKKGVVRGVGQELLGPSYFFIPLVLGPLNSLVWWEVPHTDPGHLM